MWILRRHEIKCSSIFVCQIWRGRGPFRELCGADLSDGLAHDLKWVNQNMPPLDTMICGWTPSILLKKFVWNIEA